MSHQTSGKELHKEKIEKAHQGNPEWLEQRKDDLEAANALSDEETSTERALTQEEDTPPLERLMAMEKSLEHILKEKERMEQERLEREKRARHMKIALKHVGYFSILESIGKTAYKLEDAATLHLVISTLKEMEQLVPKGENDEGPALMRAQEEIMFHLGLFVCKMIKKSKHAYRVPKYVNTGRGAVIRGDELYITWDALQSEFLAMGLDLMTFALPLRKFLSINEFKELKLIDKELLSEIMKFLSKIPLPENNDASQAAA